MHIAAHWASTGREVLLIEADPAGGSMSSTLGIQFTPGSASFIASGLPGLSNHLVDHSQDVLFESLHVMPAPSSPTGARGVFDRISERAEDLRQISEYEMAVIIDGGRITADTINSSLTTLAAGVLVVSRANSDLSSIKSLKPLFGATDDESSGPVGCAVTVGPNPLSADEWLEQWDLIHCGSMEMAAEAAGDLSVFLARNKRKSRKWRASVELVADKLHKYANPPVSEGQEPSHRPVGRSPRPVTEEGFRSGIAYDIHSEIAHSGIADDTAQPTRDASEAGLPAAATGLSDERAPLMALPEDFQLHEGEMRASEHEQPHFLPPPPEGQDHFLPPPPEGHQVTQEPAPDVHPQAASEPVLEPHLGYEAQPTGYEQTRPEAHPGYEQTSQPEHPAQYQHQGGYPQPEYQTAAGYQQAPLEYRTEPEYPQPEHQPQAHPGHLPTPQPEHPSFSTPPAPTIAPTGPFREWAARLHNLHIYTTAYTTAAQEQAR